MTHHQFYFENIGIFNIYGKLCFRLLLSYSGYLRKYINVSAGSTILSLGLVGLNDTNSRLFDKWPTFLSILMCQRYGFNNY